MNRTELARSRKNYTYGHYLDGKLIYIGEGIRYRGWDFADRPYKDRREEVEVRIFGIFDNKQIAVFNEGLLIYQERMDGNTHLLNKADYGTGNTGLTGELASNYGRTGELASAYGRTGELHPLYGETGEKCSNFQGHAVGTNRTTGKTVVFDGNKSMKERGFNASHISACILGNRASHKNFTFIRTTDEDYLRQLLAADNFHDEESKLILQQFLG